MTIQLGGQNEELNTSYNSLVFALGTRGVSGLPGDGVRVRVVHAPADYSVQRSVRSWSVLCSPCCITNTTVSVMVLLGVIILIGIVVNNAIVLIDYTNQLRDRRLLETRSLEACR